MTSIFLAREFGARVWATELWIAASDNQRRIEAAGREDFVTPIHAEAHAMWRTHWNMTGKVTVDHADVVEDGWSDWLRFNDVTAPTVTGWRADAAVAMRGMLEADRGRCLGFGRVAATKRS